MAISPIFWRTRAKPKPRLSLYDRALKREPDNAQARLNRAVLHLLTGNLKEGWRDYAARIEGAGQGAGLPITG